MKKYSGPIVEGVTRAPSRALLYACGYTEKQLRTKPTKHGQLLLLIVETSLLRCPFDYGGKSS